MAVWDPEDWGFDRYLVQNGTCSAFHSREILGDAIAWLAEHGYRIVRMTAAGWVNHQILHDDFASSLDFPEYYGRNFNALLDCLRDVAEISYGWSPGDRGLVIVLDSFDTFHMADPDASQSVLDIVTWTGQRAALFGNRILCLVQSDDPRIKFEDVGALSIRWNLAEFLDSRRLGEP